MREENLIRRIKLLIENYTFEHPFANYLKQYFKSHPEMGANDRRLTREWCFSFFRIGVNLPDESFELRLAIACFLCSSNINPSIAYLIKTHSGLNEQDLLRSIEEKLELVKGKYPAFAASKIFQMQSHLSTQIKKDEWYMSFLKKPKVWIRIRKSKKEIVVKELVEKNIPYQDTMLPDSLSFQPEVALENTDAYQKGFFEIQDVSSQRTRDFFKPNPGEKWWDACAGAGGKSLLLKEEEKSVQILATDLRKNILSAYAERMKKLSLKSYKTFEADLSSDFILPVRTSFDGIIADVPCSGSGTWSRSPEWLQKDISEQLKDHFIPLQRKIVKNLLLHLKPGFPLIYITCSAFIEENEENIEYFTRELALKPEKCAYLEGYEFGGDTLFVARLIKSS